MSPRAKSVVEKWAADRGIKLREDVVAIDHIHPNPWNPNVMDDTGKRANRESIAMFGFIDLPHVREHPDLDGHYQLIDGEHRVAEARELGYEDLPVTILDIDTPTAMRLTVILNQSGSNDDVRLGALLGELEKQGAPGEEMDWSVGLAFDDTTLKHLLQLGTGDWTPPNGDLANHGGGGGGGSDDEWVTVTARMPRDAHAVFEEARGRAVENEDVGDHDDEHVAAGLLIEVLAASYLATPSAPPDDEDGPEPPDG